MNAEELKKAQEESYDKWFERWYAKENLEEKLKQSAMRGFKGYSYKINDNFTEYIRRRMNNEKFINKLKEKLDGFNIYRIEPERYERTILGRHAGYGWTKPEVIISWKEIDE